MRRRDSAARWQNLSHLQGCAGFSDSESAPTSANFGCWWLPPPLLPLPLMPQCPRLLRRQPPMTTTARGGGCRRCSTGPRGERPPWSQTYYCWWQSVGELTALGVGAASPSAVALTPSPPITPSDLTAITNLIAGSGWWLY